MTVIHANVYDPTRSIFKTTANTRAECQTISCNNPDCPLLARKQCYMRGGLFGNRCPYGQSRRETGLTKRAAGFHSWISEKRKQHEGVPYLDIPPAKLEFIGGYVLLPYAHMTMCKTVPFKSHGGFMSSGDPFLPREFWTIETVFELLNHRPLAMMGGEITSYQKEEVPKFLLHLREADSEMWVRLITACPKYDTQANHVGRKAILKTLNSPIEWTESSSKGEYPVHWKWNGETITTDSINAFQKTWGRIDVESVVINAAPSDRAEVVVQSNDWVNDRTEFIS